MRKDRFEFFTDTIFAIIMTLMIIEIKLPDITAENFWLLLQHISIYALSFLVLAITWMNHHAMFLPIEKVNARIIWINFAMLFTMSLTPLATAPLGEHFFQKESHMLYGAVMSSVTLPYTLLQYNVNKLVPGIKREVKRKINRLNWIATTLYLLSIPLSLLSIYFSAVIFIMFPIIYFTPFAGTPKLR